MECARHLQIPSRECVPTLRVIADGDVGIDFVLRLIPTGDAQWATRAGRRGFDLIVLHPPAKGDAAH